MEQSQLTGRQWILVQKTGKGAFWLDEDIVTTIGSEGCNINVQSLTVNRQHAVLWFDPDSCYFYLKDLDTESGTFINGKKMNPSITTKLKNMDMIRFGFDSNLYQIRCELSSLSRRNSSVDRNFATSGTHTQQPFDMECKPQELPFPQSSCKNLERNDSGHCSSSSPCSPVKAGPFPSGPTSPTESTGETNTEAAPSDSKTNSGMEQLATPSSPSPVSEELFSNKYSPMAFTIDFGPTETKNFDLSASISKFAPTRHRRTPSNSKVERRAGSEGGDSENSRRNLTPSTNSDSDFGKGKVKIEPKISRGGSASPSKNSPTRKLSPQRTLRTQKPKLVAAAATEDDRHSETGTYTVQLDSPVTDHVKKEGKDTESIFERDEDIESPLDSSLEWVREWAERASSQIEQNQTPPPQPYKGYEDENSRVFLHDADLDADYKTGRNSSLQRKKLNRNSWHESYTDDPEARYHELAAPSPKLSPGVHRRASREASAVSDYSAYGRSRPVQGHLPYGYTNSYGPARSNPAHQQQKGRERLSDYCENVNSSHQSLTPNSGGATAGTNSPNSNISSPSFSREDGGRFSLRASTRGKPTALPQPVSQPQPAAKPTAAWNPLSRLAQPRSIATVAPSAKPNGSATPAAAKKPPPEKTALSKKQPLLSSGKRANSTLTAKEVELANWNRRKSYDPRKAAALGKNKDKRLPAEAAVEEPGQRNNPDGAASIPKSPSFHNANEYCLDSSTEELGIGCGSEEDYDEPHRTGSLTRMRSRFEDGYVHRQPASPQRQKHKFEALDCLVISTIHSLSNKVRTSSRHLLERIQLQAIDDENGALVEEMISQLKELEVNASPQKGPSRELSGTLKNMKKLEQVILVLERLLCGESDEL